MTQKQLFSLIDQSDFFRIGNWQEATTHVEKIPFYGFFHQGALNPSEENLIQQKMKEMEYIQLVLPNIKPFSDFIKNCSKTNTMKVQKASIFYAKETDHSHLFPYIPLDNYIEIIGKVNNPIRTHCIHLRNSNFFNTNLFWSFAFQNNGCIFPSSSITLRKKNFGFQFLKEDILQYETYLVGSKINEYPYLWQGKLNQKLCEYLKEEYLFYPYSALELYKNKKCIYRQPHCDPDNFYEVYETKNHIFY